jgi:hypothetical protein
MGPLLALLLLFVPLPQRQESLELNELLKLESAWNEAHVNGDATVLDQALV